MYHIHELSLGGEYRSSTISWLEIDIREDDTRESHDSSDGIICDNWFSRIYHLPWYPHDRSGSDHLRIYRVSFLDFMDFWFSEYWVAVILRYEGSRVSGWICHKLRMTWTIQDILTLAQYRPIPYHIPIHDGIHLSSHIITESIISHHMSTREDISIWQYSSHTADDDESIFVFFSEDLDCLILRLSTRREECEYRDEYEYLLHIESILEENLESKVEKKKLYLQ